MSKRTAQVGQQILRELVVLARESLSDPRIGLVTFTGVEMSGDLHHAKVFFSTLGDEKQRERTLAALKSARGFLRAQLAGTLRLRTAPELEFRFDDSLAQGSRIDQLLRDIGDDAAKEVNDDPAPLADESEPSK